MELRGLTRGLVVRTGTAMPRTLAHGPIRAHAITRADLDDDVRGINAGLT